MNYGILFKLRNTSSGGREILHILWNIYRGHSGACSTGGKTGQGKSGQYTGLPFLRRPSGIVSGKVPKLRA
ncbi:hypothetical protein AGMMS49944_10750 [Spirochaetia bacterium]|nr:hypothetical protein AGMMS49944_10750 [Spirochaetia bacterium]